MTKLQKAASVIINTCLKLKRDEKLLILTDEPLWDIAQVLFRTAIKRTKLTNLLMMSNAYTRKGIDSSIARLMKEMDAILAVTTHSISHTDARRNACRKGVRIASMPGILEKSFIRIGQMNFERIDRLSRKLCDILTIAKEVTVTAPNGTSLSIPIAHKKGYADTGLLHKNGSFSNLPAGEASIAPEDGKTEGVLVVDSGMGLHPSDREQLVITIKQGRATRISGDVAAQRLRRTLAPYGSDSRLVAEFGLGTNDAARISGYSLEDEKVLGTIHLALGNNVSFGGSNNVPIHLDGVVYNASVVVDGMKILDNGRLVLI